MKKNGLAILVLIGLFGYGVYDYVSGSNREPQQNPSAITDDSIATGTEKGQRAPNFTLNDLDGNPVQLTDYRGKRVLLNFWASWCPPCRVEMPHMQKTYEEYGEDTIILGVNLTSTEESPKDVKPFIDKLGLTFPIVLDEDGILMNDYKVAAYPTTYVIDEQGVIREVFRGAINFEIMRKTIDAL